VILPDLISPGVFLSVYATLIAALIGWVPKEILGRLRKRRLLKNLDDDPYTASEIKHRATTGRSTYVPPDCQDNNPADTGPDLNRRRIFSEVDRLLGPPVLARLTLILADTGMGKSTFLDKYYDHHARSLTRRKRFRLVVAPLNGLRVDELLLQIGPQARSETVLLLDALDEDDAAVGDFTNRLANIADLVGRFRALVVTCRTQFLTDVACVPDEIDITEPSGPMPLSAGGDRKVHRLYLSPFSGSQVKKYLNARFPFWRHPALRLRAGRTAQRFRDLMSRPLLLTFIQDLASSSEEPRYSFQAYRQIVDAWLLREKRKHILTIQTEDLLRFSEDFAVSLFVTGRDRMPLAELRSMAIRFRVGPVLREVQERSLLHNDAENNWKFAHRSIMEYLLVNAASKASNCSPWLDRPWTNQMRLFASELLISGECKSLPGADLRGLDVRGADLSGRDLSGANLSGADLSGSDLRSTRLCDSNLTGAHLTKAKLDLADLRGARLNGAVFDGADLARARGLTLFQIFSAATEKSASWPSQELVGHSSLVAAVAIAPDSRRAVSASWDTTLKVWSLETGGVLDTLRGHSDRVLGVALANDGQRLVSASADKTLGVWDFKSGARLRTLIGHSEAVLGVGTSTSGPYVVSASADRTLKVWDLEDGRELRTLAGHRGLVNAAALTPDGRIAISASADTTLKVWDLESGRVLRTLSGHASAVNSVALTPSGRWIISASDDKTVKVWELDTGEEVRTLLGHSGPVRGVVATPDGRHALSASDDKSIRVWNLETGSELCVLVGHSQPVKALAISADGRTAISGSGDRTLRCWPPPEARVPLGTLDVARNVELMAQQAIIRRGVYTPEFYFTKHFDNSRLPVDPIQRHQIHRLSQSVVLLFVLVMVYGLQHFSMTMGARRIESEKQQLEELRKENIELKLTEAQLKSRKPSKPKIASTQPATNPVHAPRGVSPNTSPRAHP